MHSSSFLLLHFLYVQMIIHLYFRYLLDLHLESKKSKYSWISEVSYINAKQGERGELVSSAFSSFYLTLNLRHIKQKMPNSRP